MTDPSPNLPSPEEVYAHAVEHAPRPRGRMRLIALALVGLAIGIMLFFGDSLVGLVAPWLVLGGLVTWGMIQRRAAAAAQQGVRESQELAAWRENHRAFEQSWQLLPMLRSWPELHVQAVMLIATRLDSLRAYESALAGYQYLLDHLPDDHPTGQMIRLQRVSTLLHDDRLADADDELRRLSRMDLTPLGRALLRSGQLHQQVKTGHFDESDRFDDSLIEQLQPLGIDAGYGYAMASTICHQHDRSEAAEQWWRRATLLMHPRRLTDDLPEVTPVAHLPAESGLAAAMEADRRG